jgi:hypothetical protein
MKNNIFFQALSILILIFQTVIVFNYNCTNTFPQVNSNDAKNKKAAVKYYEKRKNEKAISILKKLINLYPNDPEINYGLGYLLLQKAAGEKDINKQKELGKRSKELLFKAKELGVVDEDLDSIVDAFMKKDGNKLGQLILVLSLHPPQIFENDPPEGIIVPEGYHHKGNGDFEGNYSGRIWKEGEYNIKYDFSLMGEPAVTHFDKEIFIEYKEIKIGDKNIKYGVTNDKMLIITVTDGISFNYRVEIKDNQEIERVLSLLFKK